MLQGHPSAKRAWPAGIALLFAASCGRPDPSTRSSSLLQADKAPAAAATPADPLPSWREGPTKRAILQFLADVTSPASPKFVAPSERTAAFDNDGTLWVEKPFPPEQSFAFDRARTLAANHPEWRKEQPFQAILAGDEARLTRMTRSEEVSLIDATHTGITVPAFRTLARTWLDTWTHPRFERHPTQLVYEPMLELLADLRQNGFEVFLCSGDTIEFLRAFAPERYGIPQERIAGTGLLTEVSADARGPALLLAPSIIDPYNTFAGKPVNLQRLVGRMPTLAIGNEDGDLPLLELSTAASGPRLAMLVHHDDADREYAYDRGAERALREARERGWVVISMLRDFERIFPSR
jgi:phosphoserine phosphatase